MARFVIESRFGNFSVLGERMLAVRVSELAAIETLQNVQQSDAFKDALSASGGKLVDFGKSAVSEPGKTVENIGAESARYSAVSPISRSPVRNMSVTR